MERKYELTDETKEINGRTLHRIVAVRDFGGIKKGTQGGWIEKESNLSHEGNCWVYDEAMVFKNAEVSGNAKVLDHATVYDNAVVFHNTAVYGSAEVFGNAMVYGWASVYDKAKVFGNATIHGRAKVYGRAQICEAAKVCGDAEVHNEAEVYGRAQICEAAKVCGDAEVSGEAYVCGDAVVSSNRDYIVFKNWWSSGRYFTWTRSNNLWKVGCFYGTGEELIRKAYCDSEESGREYERIVQYVEGI